MAHDRPLWAPWRIDFIRSAKDSACFLCNNYTQDSANNEEELIVFRGNRCFIILNRYPYNSGHLLIAPYRHIGDIAKLEPPELHEIMDLTVLAKQILTETLHPDAFNAGLNLGVAAGAGVADHVHMHIVPRWNGDTNFMSVIDDVRVVPEALVATAEMLRSAFNNSSK